MLRPSSEAVVTVSRRDFLKQSGAALAVIPALQDGPASNLPQADGSIRELAMLALDAAKSAGATYADVRVSRAQSQSVATREDRVTNISDRDTMGFGIRVLAAGAWGFAASRELTRPEVQRVARTAVSQARANRRAIQGPVVLAPVDPIPDGRWSAPARIDPFTIPIEDKVALLLRCNAEALKVRGTRFVTSNTTGRSRRTSSRSAFPRASRCRVARAPSTTWSAPPSAVSWSRASGTSGRSIRARCCTPASRATAPS